jgi:hypothetical protein
MAVVALICQKLAADNPFFDFLHGGEVAPDSRWRMPPHRHAFHELIVVCCQLPLFEKLGDPQLIRSMGL